MADVLMFVATVFLFVLFLGFGVCAYLQRRTLEETQAVRGLLAQLVLLETKEHEERKRVRGAIAGFKAGSGRDLLRRALLQRIQREDQKKGA